ncbi:MAG TPA: FecR domain-containing protein [Puia sp.]|nr:FecR domain-containing protein [Puia sp.]
MSHPIDTKDFASLFERYLSNQCSPEEIGRLLQHFNVADETFLREYVEKEFLRAEQRPATDHEKELVEVLMTGVQKRIARMPREKKLYRMLRWSAVAAVLVVVVGGYWLWRRPGGLPEAYKNASPMAARAGESVQPGRSGATLRLAGGKTILLDSAADGASIMQDRVRITKHEGQVVYSGGSDEVTYNSLVTDRGREWQAVLPDGTKVWLNAATTLTFPTSFDRLPSRTVELDGEAYFEVAKDKNKPFIVHTRAQDVKDIGTAFNVSSYNDDPFTKTTLLEGAVQINGKKVLRPGEQAATDRKGETIVVPDAADGAVAWKDGRFDFNDDNIYDIMRKVARWYNVDVVYKGRIPMESMAGSLSRFEDVSLLLGVIRKTGLVRISIAGKTIYVEGK